MSIDPWPVVARAQLVRAFRPGEPSSREAPFRTLRLRGWATKGVSVVTRKNDRASGRLSIFSILNVDAARCARGGDEEGASAFAETAASLEESKVFVRLCALLSGKPSEDVSSALEGEIPESRWPELHELLREIALKTRRLRANKSVMASPGVISGKISEVWPDFLVLRSEDGHQTVVPRWLAHSAHRESLDDCLALVTDQLDEHHMLVNAVPAIEVSSPYETTFTPFGRNAPEHKLTKKDALLLSRPPAKLKVFVPVVIDG